MASWFDFCPARSLLGAARWGTSTLGSDPSWPQLLGHSRRPCRYPVPLAPLCLTLAQLVARAGGDGSRGSGGSLLARQPSQPPRPGVRVESSLPLVSAAGGLLPSVAPELRMPEACLLPPPRGPHPSPCWRGLLALSHSDPLLPSRRPLPLPRNLRGRGLENQPLATDNLWRPHICMWNGKRSRVRAGLPRIFRGHLLCARS